MSFQFPSDKLFFSISEVSKLLDVPQRTLRQWETTFPQIQPRKNKAGVRLFRKKDVEILRSIKKLIVDEGYTVEGAKQRISEGYMYYRDEKELLKKYKRRMYAIKKDINKILDILEGRV
ncbi:MAG: hypothetical protein Kow00108_23780 [Calditrichia bacterium]